MGFTLPNRGDNLADLGFTLPNRGDDLADLGFTLPNRGDDLAGYSFCDLPCEAVVQIYIRCFRRTRRSRKVRDVAQIDIPTASAFFRPPPPTPPKTSCHNYRCLSQKVTYTAVTMEWDSLHFFPFINFSYAELIIGKPNISYGYAQNGVVCINNKTY